MAQFSIDELEKEVAELEEKLNAEIKRKNNVQAELDAASKELSDLKQKTAGVNGTHERKAEKVRSEPAFNSGAEKSATVSKSQSESVVKAKPDEKVKKKNKDYKNEPIKGWLNKKNGNSHKWKKKWFVLEVAKKQLLYYEKEESSEPPSMIPLTNAACFAHVERKGVVKPLLFNVRTETRDFLFRADTKEEKDKWVRGIKFNSHKGELSLEEKKALMSKKKSFVGTVDGEDK